MVQASHRTLEERNTGLKSQVCRFGSTFFLVSHSRCKASVWRLWVESPNDRAGGLVILSHAIIPQAPRFRR